MEYASQFLFLLFWGDIWEESGYFYFATIKLRVFWIFKNIFFKRWLPYFISPRAQWQYLSHSSLYPKHLTHHRGWVNICWMNAKMNYYIKYNLILRGKDNITCIGEDYPKELLLIISRWDVFSYHFLLQATINMFLFIINHNLKRHFNKGSFLNTVSLILDLPRWSRFQLLCYSCG